MSTPYDSHWQASAYSLQDTEYRPPPSGAMRPLDYYAYPPKPNQYPAERPYNAFLAPVQQKMGDGMLLRGGTPSPTPSEQKELSTGAIDWKTMMNWRFWIRKDWKWYYAILVVIIVLTALMTFYHTQIVDWLTPVTKWLHGLSFGWVVPIAVLFVISFPPLFGHEIVAVLCGLVWGLWIGFGIVAAGTYIGEVGNFYAFKYCCSARGEKLERESIFYACLAKVVRVGGFKIALIVRLSAIPGHFTTAIFSTCGMGIFAFSVAAILSLPKQFITVYLGVLLEQSSTGPTNTKSKLISAGVFAVTFLVTIAAGWYILHKMNQAKPDVIYARRKARQAKLAKQQGSFARHARDLSDNTLHTTNYSYSNSSESEIPLTSRAMPMGYAPNFPEPKHFQDSSSEYSYEPHLHAPKPQRPERPITQLYVENEAVGSSEYLRPTDDPETGLSRRLDPNLEAIAYSPRLGTSDQSHSKVTYDRPRDPASLRPGYSANQPVRDLSPAVHLRSENVGLEQRGSSAATAPQLSKPAVPSPDQPMVGPNRDSHQGYHVPEESYDSFHTASPEPMATDEERPQASRGSGTQQGLSTKLGVVDVQEVSPHLRSRPPVDYTFR